MIVNVFDWKNQVKVASNKVSAKVKAISFAIDGSYFVTVGNRHVKFWYLDYSRPRTSVEAVPLMGRSAILGDQRNNNFCDVECGRGAMSESTFAITESGLLCEFNSRRLLDKWVELRAISANCLRVGEKWICVGCSDGIIRMFHPSNLMFICTLPRPHALGIDVARGLSKTDPLPDHSETSVKYPDAIAVTIDEEWNKVAAIYSDRSMYVWDLKDPKRIGKLHSYLYHSSCIWGIEPYQKRAGVKSLLPPGTFITCSSDDTIRIWNVELNQSCDSYIYKRNIFSSCLLKVLYIDPELKHICDPDINISGNDKSDNGTYDGKNGVRCIRLSPDGKHLASGDRSGNIRVFDLETHVDLCKIEAHDSEVLSLEFCDPQSCLGTFFLASASRDRLIHIFDVNRQYSFVETLDDHNSAITALKFVPYTEKKAIELISCGADKSIIFRNMILDNPNSRFLRDNNVVGKTSLYDMELDASCSNILTACQDRQIRVYGVEGGKFVKSFKGSPADDGTLIKISMDPSGQFIATSSTDKSLNLLDYESGECLATASGHSELITGIKFSPNGRNLISVSGDGCIFIWKLHSDISNAISTKLGLPPVPPEKPAFIPIQPLPENVEDLCPEGPESPTSAVITIEQSALPSWAKKKIGEETLANDASVSPTLNETNGLNNKWNERIESSGSLHVKSYYPKDAVITYPKVDADRKHWHSDSSKSNSIKNGDDDENPTSGSDVVYYPQAESSSAHESPFEVKGAEKFQDNHVHHYSNTRLMPSFSVPNFNELNSDEDVGSGRSAEGVSDPATKLTKNPLYISTENVDRMDSKRTFLTSVENTDPAEDLNASRTSLSARHVRTSPPEAPNGKKRLNNSLSGTSMTPLNRAGKRREDLAKAISEARKKLENVSRACSGPSTMFLSSATCVS